MADSAARRDRARLARMGLAITGCLLALAWLWAGRAAYPSDGTVVALESASWHPDGLMVGVAVGPGNPLRPGDLVTAIDGRPLAAGSLSSSAPRIGDVVVYDVVRDGERIEVPVTLIERPFWALVARHWPILPYATLLVLLSSLVVAWRPRDPAAVTLYGVAVLHIVGYASGWYGTQVIDVATDRLWVTVVGQAANCLLWACMLHFAVSFPQPWPVLRRRPWLVVIGYVTPFAAFGAFLAASLPGAEGLRRTWILIGLPGPAAWSYPVLILVALVASYLLTRDRLERRRIRLVSYGFVFLGASYLLLGRIPELFFGRPLVEYQYIALSAIPTELLYAAAVLRYRLWDIQITLRRSLVYGLVTIILVGVYLGVAAAINVALDTSLGPGTVLVAMVVALSFSATRTAARRAVSRLVFGEREDPYEVLRQLGRRLESASSAEAVLNQLVSTLVRTLRLTHAAIEVPGLSLTSASHGTPGPTATSIDLNHEGEPIGRLVLDAGADREPFGPSDRRLLDGLAQQVSATAHSLVLAARLQRSLEATVTVLEDERRRLRREIHDSLGPTIASASIRLDVGRSLMRTDPDEAERVFADLGGVHRTLVENMRHLVDGLRPTILDSLGLEAALRELVARLGGSLRTSLTCTVGPEPLPAAVEVAVYRIVSEALTNVVRHSRATSCTVRVWPGGASYHDSDPAASRELYVEVLDDGQGTPATYRPGMGLTSIRERCAELGGRVEITGALPQGTVVRCRIPVAPTQRTQPAPPAARPQRSPHAVVAIETHSYPG